MILKACDPGGLSQCCAVCKEGQDNHRDAQLGGAILSRPLRAQHGQQKLHVPQWALDTGLAGQGGTSFS